MTKRFFFFAGEPSGDLHGACLLASFQRAYPTAIFEGVGGPRMTQEGFSPILPMEEFQVMGFTDVFRSLLRLRRHMNTLVSHILSSCPTLVFLIDYPGFNLRLVRRLRKKGYTGKIVQYICPKVWAWGAHRIETMARNLDLLLTIFPFEPPLFAHTTLQVNYVGHPLIERMSGHVYQANWKSQVGLPQGPFIALFPGSRPAEILRNAPLLFSAVHQYIQIFPNTVLALSCGQESLRQSLLQCLADSPLRSFSSLYLVPPRYHYEMMKEAFFAVAKSGTVTVELALHQTPTIVFFVVNPLNKWLIRLFIRPRLSYFCMVNILMNREVFPEWIAKPFTSQDLFMSMCQMQKEEKREACQNLCQQLLCDLGGTDHSLRVLASLQKVL